MIMAAGNHYDDLETRSVDEREAALASRLPDHIDHAKRNSGYFGDILKDVDAKSITSRDALAAVPMTRKSELVDWQSQRPPLGGLTAAPAGSLRRIYQSPGPIYDPEGGGADWWRMARALHAAGFRRGDIIHNAFSYHLTPAGAMLESGAEALGCAVVPAGVGNTDLQAQAINHIRPAGYVGTPSFLKIILQKAAEMGLDISSLGKACVGGEAFMPDQRQAFEAAGIQAFNVYASADLGSIAYETEARDGLITDEGILIEIVRPGTGDPVAEGEVGEVVVTLLYNEDYPLVRFATGDLSAVLPGASPCGRTNMRLRGWMGRADQAAKVRGMFVQPSQIAAILKRHPEIGKARLTVDHDDGGDSMCLACEVAEPGADNGTAAKIAETIQSVCKLRGEVDLVAAGSLPNDGKVIDDVRSFE
jgi:phenylacetate-CoA ligase